MTPESLAPNDLQLTPFRPHPSHLAAVARSRTERGRRWVVEKPRCDGVFATILIWAAYYSDWEAFEVVQGRAEGLEKLMAKARRVAAGAARDWDDGRPRLKEFRR